MYTVLSYYLTDIVYIPVRPNVRMQSSSTTCLPVLKIIFTNDFYYERFRVKLDVSLAPSF